VYRKGYSKYILLFYHPKSNNSNVLKKNNRLPSVFYQREVTIVAPDLLGKILVRKFKDGTLEKYRITEVEAYRGRDDKACHAHKGKTKRTEVMFLEGGLVYVYLIYGMYWLLNIVTGEVDDASAVLVRGIEGISGPGRVGKKLHLDKSFYGEDLNTSEKIWIENSKLQFKYKAMPRVGINYAGEPWISKPWRFILDERMGKD
jgi:DNA-3-methyladenine glycosylase